MALNIQGIELDFDFTNSQDFKRYHDALERMEQAWVSTEGAAGTDFDTYIQTLDRAIQIFATFLDGVFEDGASRKLLGEKPSLGKIADIQDALMAHAEAQGKAMQAHLAKYTPNRARGQSE